MARMVSRGAFIVLEGVDKSGKTTQCKKLVETLTEQGIPAKLWRFPDRDTAIGKVINDYLEKKSELEDHAVHLLFAANRWEAVPQMTKLLNAGTTLIVDRYSFSGVAFTAAKNGMDLHWCRQPEVGLPKPDVVLYLTLSADAASAREEFGGERYEQTDFQRKVAKNYQILKEWDWKVIDASKTIEEVHSELKEITNSVIEEVKEKDVGELWVEQSGGPWKRPCPDGAIDAHRKPSGDHLLQNGGAGDVHTNGVGKETLV